MIRRNGQLSEATWEEAMNLIVHQSNEVIKKSTSLGIGFYTSGQLFLEEYYTLGLLVEIFLDYARRMNFKDSRLHKLI